VKDTKNGVTAFIGFIGCEIKSNGSVVIPSPIPNHYLMQRSCLVFLAGYSWLDNSSLDVAALLNPTYIF
jgi:hypothetical protein